MYIHKLRLSVPLEVDWAPYQYRPCHGVIIVGTRSSFGYDVARGTLMPQLQTPYIPGGLIRR